MQSGGKYAIVAGLTTDIEGSWEKAPFRVTHAGVLYAEGAEIKGTLTAGAGSKIGG